MADLKTYDIMDFKPLVDYLRTHGENVVMAKGSYFSRMEEPSVNIGVVNSGGFAFSHPDYKGDMQIMSLAFTGELIGSLISMPGGRSLFDITALCRSEISVMPICDFLSFIEEKSPEMRLRLLYAVAYGVTLRGVSFRCDSPEIRYRELLSRVPGIEGNMSMTAIASYLGITRETFARMRGRLNKN